MTYDDKLLRSYQMTFCGYTVFHHREQFVRRFSFRDEYAMPQTRNTEN